MTPYIILGLILLFVTSFVGIVLYGVWSIRYIGKVSSIILGVTFAFFFITAIWPPDSFYIEEFEYRAGFQLDGTAVVTYKRSSYPDLHGDYFLEALIKLENKDYIKLKNRIKKDVSNKCHVPIMIKKRIESTVTSVTCWSVSNESDDVFNGILFSDGKTIFYEFNQT